jgi:hypothetical protein
MPKLFDLMYPGGQYTDREGQEKTRWLKCGAVIETKDGKKKVKLESLPVEFNGWLECFANQPHEQAARTTAAQSEPDDLGGDIPY